MLSVRRAARSAPRRVRSHSRDRHVNFRHLNADRPSYGILAFGGFLRGPFAEVPGALGSTRSAPAISGSYFSLCHQRIPQAQPPNTGSASEYRLSLRIQAQPPNTGSASEYRLSLRIQAQPPNTGSASEYRLSLRIQAQPPNTGSASEYRLAF